MFTLPTSARAGLAWIEPAIPLDYGGPSVPYERPDEDFTDQSIYDLFEVVAARDETAVAVCDAVGRLTYAEVRSAARALAANVRATVPAGKAVAVLLPNGAESLIAVLACLAAQRTCIVLNAADPAERNGTILRRAAVAAVITKDQDAAALAPEGAVRILAVRQSDHPIEGPGPAAAPPRSDEPAIVLYTSGSTGEPKGIVVSQAAMLWRLRNAIVSCHFNRHDCLLSLSALVTTGGLVASLSALLSGCPQFIVSVSAGGLGNLLALMREERVTLLWSVPALLRLLLELDSGDAFAHLRVVRTFGERLPWADLVKWRAILPADCRVYITYGQTEGYATGWFVPPDRAGEDGAVPIGYLLPQQQYAVIDEAGNSVASGEIGELIIRSRYVALGEWEDGQCKPGRARPDVTDAELRVLSTGDLARVDSDGVLHFVGRRDRQVKIRGQRVEPAELEDVLLRVPDVTAAAVAVRRDGEETSLLAFIVACDGADGLLIDRVRAKVRQALPSYMQPVRILQIERLPLLPGGKVDQSALLALAAATPRRRAVIANGPRRVDAS
jgi:amino acid adenylation domain-containing protein